MIGYLQGKILSKQPPKLLLDVNGVGYEIEASMNTFYKLPEVGKPLALFMHLVVRDDAHLLYGFFAEQERKLFRALIKVNGVGPKMALTILSSVDPDGFVACITNHDTASLVKMPGVGKKTAERLIVEMGDRLNDWFDGELNVSSMPASAALIGNNAVQEAISALIALGYKPQEASTSINRVAKDGESSEQLIKLALQGMG